MKITHICLSGLYMSGWGYQDNLIVKYQLLDGHDLSVIANRYVYDQEGNYIPTDKIEEIDENGAKIYRLEQIGKKRLMGPAERVHYKGLYETLIKLNPDIIFLHNPQIMDTDDIAKYMKETKSSRLYVDSHSDYSNSGRNFLSKHILHGILWRNKVKKLIPYTEKFYGVLPARVDFMIDRYHTPKDKTELLVMGMDDVKAEEATDHINEIKEKMCIAKEDFLIVTGGKIDHAKRQTLILMDAIHKLAEMYPDIKIRLIVFGSVAADLKEEFLSKCDKNISEGDKPARDSVIQYIGWLNADETYPYFAAADLAVFPGRHSVMWEQVAGQGIPMLVKYWEGTTHVDLGGNCRFIYKDTEEEIIKALSEILLSVDNSKCGREAIEFNSMKKVAGEKGKEVFSYRSISRKCIGQ